MSRIGAKKGKKGVNYDMWGYIFIAPFFIVYIVFSLLPLLSTFYNSFFENYMKGLKHIGPNFVGLDNFKLVLSNQDTLKYFINTIVIWVIGFLPQIFISLLLAAWFSNPQMRVKGARFFKTVIYMPNLIMAAALSMLFFTLFSNGGPVNDLLQQTGLVHQPIRFLTMTTTTIGMIAFMNFLMWFGNTTILLMAAMLGIDPTLYEAAQCDGASYLQVFFRITLPLIRPILSFVLITSMLGGIQMFDLPQILTNGEGTPNRTTMTIVMYLNKHLYSKNYGMSGAVSVILFVVTVILSLVVFRGLRDRSKEEKA